MVLWTSRHIPDSFILFIFLEEKRANFLPIRIKKEAHTTIITLLLLFSYSLFSSLLNFVFKQYYLMRLMFNEA